MERLNTNLIMKSLGFHGQPLQKVWEGERGENDLIMNGITNPDYSVYRIRQKTLTFQDRAKRLKLHQFLAKKAEFLYDNSLVNGKIIISKTFEHDKKIVDSINHLPYYEYFLNIDKNKRQRYFFESCQAGDLVYGSLINKISGGYGIKIHCTVGESPRFLTDLNVKAFLPHSLACTIPEKKNKQMGVVDYVLCEIVEVVPDTDKMIVTMKGEKEDAKYGIIKLDDFPEVYKQLINSSEASYDSLLEASPGFNNPYCFEVLEEQLGLSSFEHYSNMSSLRGRFPQQEYSNELRQVQASKWAFRSVAEGIEHFKEGRHPEAFQCLNKALNIDPRNVEGLVARGALYANSGSFKKAVEDFETALKLNQSHANARKYMGETLVALGRSYEEDNKIDEARKAYQDCLAIIPHHEEAQNSLDFLKSKNIGKQFIEPNELQLPTLNITKSSLDQNKLNEASTSGSNKRSDILDDKKSKKIKKKKSRGGKKEKRSTTSSSESDSSDSSDSSSETSSSTDSSSTSDSEVNSHSKKKRQRKRQKSMSPLSKRMSLMNESGDGNNFPNQLGGDSNHDSGLDDYELKVRKFLEMTRDEDDYEEKVRRFVEEASKYRKERKILEEKAKKKKRKEAKKLKKESKKRRREKDREERKKVKMNKKMESKLDLDAIENKKIREALKLFENFPVLDEIGNKLSSLLEKSNANLEMEKPEKNSRNVTDGLYESFMEEQGGGGKWKMAFSKEKGKKQEPPPQASSSKSIPKQYAFTNESETDDERDASLGAPVQHPPPQTQINADKMRKRNQSPRSKYFESTQISKPIVKSGPVVLDKFGNFRLANMDANKPPEPPGSPKRSSRSRSRSRPVRKYSSSRSRSPRKRSRSGSYTRKYSRSRSRSFRSRTRSRTPRSRSYSRSRSRSRSVRRYGGDRRNFRGRGGYNERGTYYKPRFSNNTRGRGGRGGYRDYRDYRGGRDRGRPFRPRAARGGNRYYRYRDGSRERRYSRDRSEERDRRSYSNEHERARPEAGGSDSEATKKVVTSPPGTASVHRRDEATKNSPDIEGRWAEKTKPDQQQIDRNSIDRQDVSLEDMEKFISKAKKESKEDMIERNKDILKKSSNNASW